MGQLQQTFDGRLLTPDRVQHIRYTPLAPIYRFSVELYSWELEGVITERIRIEDRDIEGISPRKRAIYAALYQTFYDDVEIQRVTKWHKLDTKKSDEHYVEKYMDENC